MGDKILVPLYKGYGRAVEGLGEITDRVIDFMTNPQDFKLVLFTGGEDISPYLYNEKDSRLCRNNYRRDLLEMKIYCVARIYGINTTGICRGAQFLNVMAGGRMMHHIENHAGDLHYVETPRDGSILVNSLHHQMIVPDGDVRLAGWSKDRLSHIYIGKDDVEEDWRGLETEAIVIPSTSSCGVQWHPESMPKDSECYQFFYDMVENLLVMDIDSFTAEYTEKKVKIAEA